jgi:ubiquinone/menaquinone biosynthesis C-methylase UbiE
MKKKWSGERLETFIYSRDTIEHLHRYAVTFDFIKDKNVLDIASGEGYGSHLMSKVAATVSGVDIDSESVKNANKKYKKDNLLFERGSVTQIPFNDDLFDVVVSFETIEHLEEHDTMISEIKRVLKKDGILIISTPDKKNYTDLRNFKNKFHVKELYKAEFENLLKNYFNYCNLYQQLYLNGISVIFPDKAQTKMNDNIFLGDYNNVIKTSRHPLYLVAVVSNNTLNKVETSFFDGSSIIIKEAFAIFQMSNTYIVGNFILKPLKIIKRILK